MPALGGAAGCQPRKLVLPPGILPHPAFPQVWEPNGIANSVTVHIRRCNGPPDSSLLSGLGKPSNYLLELILDELWYRYQGGVLEPDAPAFGAE